MIPAQFQADGVTIPLWVSPRAGRNSIDVFQADDTAVKIKVTEAPEDGKANKAIIALLSKTLRVRKSSIILIQGATTRNKLFKILSETPLEILDRLVQHWGRETVSDCFTYPEDL